MSQENTQNLLSFEMRHAAYAAPTAEMERKELNAARQQQERERIDRLGGSATVVLDLERQLQAVTDDRKRAQNEARYATSKLEQMQQAISNLLGRDIRHLSIVGLGAALSDSRFKLSKLADYIDQARTLDDLVRLKRIASNMGVIQPQTMEEIGALMGLPSRRVV